MSDSRLHALTHAVEFHRGQPAKAVEVVTTAGVFHDFLQVGLQTVAANPTPAPAAEQTSKPRIRKPKESAASTTQTASAPTTATAPTTPAAAAAADLPDPTTTSVDDGFGDAPAATNTSSWDDEAPPAAPAKEWKKEDLRAALTAYGTQVNDMDVAPRKLISEVGKSTTVSGIDKSLYGAVIDAAKVAFLKAGGAEAKWPLK